MNTEKTDLEDKTIDCEICLKEVPASESKSEEASDYVMYYYGLECYAIWSKQQTALKQ